MSTSADAIRSVLIAGLQLVLASERRALATLRPQAEIITHYSGVAERLSQHIIETEGQIERLEAILDGISVAQTAPPGPAPAWAIATSDGAAPTAAIDAVLGTVYTNAAMAHYAIAAYKSLITLAEAAGLSLAIAPLRENLAEEQALADWLDQHLEAITMECAWLHEAAKTAEP